MNKPRYADEQIAFALTQAETGTPMTKVIRRMGISEQTFYSWEKVYRRSPGWRAEAPEAARG
jgi:putative transposase